MIIRNPDMYEEVPCSICGEVYKRHQMERLFTGATTLLLCPSCYRRGTAEVLEMRSERVMRIYQKNRKK